MTIAGIEWVLSTWYTIMMTLDGYIWLWGCLSWILNLFTTETSARQWNLASWKFQDRWSYFTRTHHFGTDRPKLSHAIMRPNKMAEPTGMIGMLRLNFIFKINSIWVCLKIAYPQIHWCIIVFQECNFEGTFTTIFQTNTISLVELCLIAAPGRQPFYSASVPLRGSAHVYGYTIFRRWEGTLAMDQMYWCCDVYVASMSSMDLCSFLANISWRFLEVPVESNMAPLQALF